MGGASSSSRNSGEDGPTLRGVLMRGESTAWRIWRERRFCCPHMVCEGALFSLESLVLCFDFSRVIVSVDQTPHIWGKDNSTADQQSSIKTSIENGKQKKKKAQPKKTLTKRQQQPGECVCEEEACVSTTRHHREIWPFNLSPFSATGPSKFISDRSLFFFVPTQNLFWKWEFEFGL